MEYYDMRYVDAILNLHNIGFDETTERIACLLLSMSIEGEPFSMRIKDVPGWRDRQDILDELEQDGVVNMPDVETVMCDAEASLDNLEWYGCVKRVKEPYGECVQPILDGFLRLERKAAA